jgi:hypothetical protein
VTTELYDYEFRPWTIDGDRRIVAVWCESPVDGRVVKQLPEGA